ncbi:MAG: hypothetical protein IJY97_09000 [Clostridia bacterium]|nr:hypothetical protein [Clostridia bacterium]
MKKIRLICLLLGILTLLSSCQTIYVEPPGDLTEETEPLVEVDLEKEYFTEGYLRKEVTAHGGVLYGDSWIYLEHNHYDKYIRSSKDKDYYDTKQLLRIVKANAHTGQVTSICLDPVCTHSPGSDCIAVAPEGTNIALVQDIVGDWLMFQYSRRTEDYGLVTTSYVYNLKTGESIDIFKNEIGEMLMTRWASRCPVGNRLYGVKNVLDYTNTGYKPGESSASKFTPETKSYLCYYDFDTRETVELFEIPAGYRITEVTNKRYILSGDEKMYSIDHNGENLQEMDVLTFSPSDVCGPYAYGFDEDTLYIYNISDNTLKTVKDSGPQESYSITNAGFIYKSWSNYEDYLKVNYDVVSFIEEYVEEKKKQSGIEEPTDEQKIEWWDEGTAAAARERERALYKINTTLSLIEDFGLEGESIPFGYFENCIVSIFHATDKYLYCGLNRGDPNNDYQKIENSASGMYVVDLATGESSEFPFLDIVLPPDMVKPEQ